MKMVFIGLTDERAPWFPPPVTAEIAASRVFAGGARHRELVEEMLPEGAEWIDIAPPMDDVFARFDGRAEGHENVVVFASGDPLFFGFAATVRRRLPDAEIRIFPALNSLQTLAHRLLMPYHAMRTVSLTGRDWTELDRALIEAAPMIGVLTDRTKTPSAIARRLLEYGFEGYSVAVGERLGGDFERIWQGSPFDAAGAAGGAGDVARGVGDVAGGASEGAARGTAEGTSTEFAAPNCVILHGQPRRAVFGIPDTEFALLDGREKMITKAPIRLATLSQLGLERARVMWDIGFCTGSVSIEARLRAPWVEVHAFEIRPECERIILENARRHSAPGIHVHIGDFLAQPPSERPDAIASPDAVFIGGHGGRLGEMVARVAENLAAGGSVVFNSVSAASRAAFETACAAAGLKLAAATSLKVDDHNPITILKATK